MNMPDARRANVARVYDALLGGKDHYAIDRAAAERLARDKPDIVPNVRANRRFLVRAVRYLAGEERVGQFLDIGAGIPVQGVPGMETTHEAALSAFPGARVVYVDNDPVVRVHTEAYLTTAPASGLVAYVHGDVRDPTAILAQAQEILDFTQPLAIMLLGVLQLISDEEDPYGIVRDLMAAAPPGSWLMITHPASDLHADGARRGAVRYAKAIGREQSNRNRKQVTQFFDGLEIAEPGPSLPPGVIQANRWRPDALEDAGPELSNWVALGRKP
jgi:hypothetical protein